MAILRTKQVVAVDAAFSLALAIDQLTTTDRAAFNIAAENVKFPLYHSTGMTRSVLRSPVFQLQAGPNAVAMFATDLNFLCLSLILHLRDSPITDGPPL